MIVLLTDTFLMLVLKYSFDAAAWLPWNYRAPNGFWNGEEETWQGALFQLGGIWGGLWAVFTIHWMFAVCCGCDTAFFIARNIAMELLYGLNAGFYCSCDNDHFFRAQKYGFGCFYAY